MTLLTNAIVFAVPNKTMHFQTTLFLNDSTLNSVSNDSSLRSNASVFDGIC